MLCRYETIARDLVHADRKAVARQLDRILPGLWDKDYLGMPGATGNLLTVTFGDDGGEGHFCRYLFDYASDPAQTGDSAEDPTDDRVAAVWGTSRREHSATRDKRG